MEGDKGDKVSKFTKLNRVYRYQASFLLADEHFFFFFLRNQNVQLLKFLGNSSQSIYAHELCYGLARHGVEGGRVGSGSWCGR